LNYQHVCKDAAIGLSKTYNRTLLEKITMIDDEKINEASRKAHDAFWETLAEQFPEIDTGDLPSEEAESFDRQCLETARLWVRLNEPDEE